jgi:creatinine amidohydrolase
MNGTQCQLGKLTRREFRLRMNAGELKVCILPIAATEQHLEHLAMEHDWRSVRAVANEVADRFTPSVLVAEGIGVGISEHHMNHPGSMTLSPGTFLSVLSDLIDSVARGGFKNILVLNGHGGNVIPVSSVWDQLLRRFKVNLQFLSYWDVLTQEDASRLLKGGQRLPDDLPGHAQEFETSIGMALFSENVRAAAISDQVDQGPSFASPETGAEFFKITVDRVSEIVEEMVQGRRVAKIPRFQP